MTPYEHYDALYGDGQPVRWIQVIGKTSGGGYWQGELQTDGPDNDGRPLWLRGGTLILLPGGLELKRVWFWKRWWRRLTGWAPSWPKQIEKT